MKRLFYGGNGHMNNIPGPLVFDNIKCPTEFKIVYDIKEIVNYYQL